MKILIGMEQRLVEGGCISASLMRLTQVELVAGSLTVLMALSLEDMELGHIGGRQLLVESTPGHLEVNPQYRVALPIMLMVGRVQLMVASGKGCPVGGVTGVIHQDLVGLQASKMKKQPGLLKSIIGAGGAPGGAAGASQLTLKLRRL